MPRPSILLLEMDPPLSMALELFFRGRGYEVRVGATPGDAMRLATSEPSDAVLIGSLPDSIDAETVAKRLRAVLGPSCQIVVLSHTIDDVAGADMVVPFGSHPRAILDGLRTLSRRRPVMALDEAS